eukprot:NODE_5685_length_919_cov_190.996231_g5462_i0.p1 GENE.NODE_5685_length_919_cov_190.996231_g5462_i0~~NODE_5685_length_919_cov_190.996231_g5462_i0.p1  ORF type:complete len:249 (+),score=45.21 NODE_5685_length_919_cov_190.996231_g5462_i0:62-808(+)
MICNLARRTYSTAPAVVGGLAASQLREQVGAPNVAAKPAYKLPAYLQNKVLRPERGCYSDKFVRENYMKASNDPQGYRGMAFTYFVKTNMWAPLLAGTHICVVHIINELLPNKSSNALETMEVDIADLEVGNTIMIMWKGKPVFVRYRTADEISDMASVPLSELRDPQTDQERFPNPDYAVLVAVCTHLGCVPVQDAGSWGAYFCPCHGSHYDHSGRIRKGPAPLNLEVPLHSLTGPTTLFIGDPAKA